MLVDRLYCNSFSPGLSDDLPLSEYFRLLSVFLPPSLEVLSDRTWWRMGLNKPVSSLLKSIQSSLRSDAVAEYSDRSSRAFLFVCHSVLCLSCLYYPSEQRPRLCKRSLKHICCHVVHRLIWLKLQSPVSLQYLSVWWCCWNSNISAFRSLLWN